MDNTNLQKFRAEWVAEIVTKKDPNSIGDNAADVKVVNIADSDIPTTSSSCSKLQSRSYPNAFEIANKYLRDVNPECCMCVKQKKKIREEKQSNRNRNMCKCSNNTSKRLKLDINTKFHEDATVNEYSEKSENLIDLLIADIDEITCIPFFDLELPKEIAVRIFQYLSLEDLASCCLVNSKWKLIAEDDLIWLYWCDALGVRKDADCVAGRSGWKIYIKEKLLERRRIRSKWKERYCEVRDLENETGGILCSAAIYDATLISAYINGSVKLWDLASGSYGQNLKEKYSRDEDVVTSLCTCVAMNNDICVAGFQNGDLMVWQRDVDARLSALLIFMRHFESDVIRSVHVSKVSSTYNTLICVVSTSNFFVLRPDENKSLQEWTWETLLNEQLGDKIVSFLLIDSSVDTPKLAVTIHNQLRVYTLLHGAFIVFDTLIGASFSNIDHKGESLVAGINSFGYNVLGGFRIRKYSLSSGKQVSNIIGPHTRITSLNYADCHNDEVVIGCSDHKIRIYELKTENLLFVINAIDSTITTLQMDEWKVVSGDKDGNVCLWDRSNDALSWQTTLKHPVHLCRFNENFLTIVNIPTDKLPQNSNWFADDLIQHRRYRGSIRVMDFTKDTYNVAVPHECRAEYDNIAGYDYNIQLIAPYDDVAALNLPKL